LTVISVATIPDRIEYIEDTMASLVKQGLPVYLWVVEKTDRSDTVLKSIPFFLLKMGVHVELVEDYGPLTKLLPALDRGFDTIITADDDTVYGEGWAARLIEAAEENPGAVVGYDGRVFSDTRYVESGEVINSADITPVDVLCGVDGVLYPASAIDKERLMDNHAVSPTNDDLSICATLRDAGVRQLVVPRGGVEIQRLRRRRVCALCGDNRAYLNDRYMFELGFIGRRTLAVIVTAYDSAKWIEESLTSIYAQSAPLGWKIDVRVGIDGCATTRQKMDEIGASYWWSKENVGAYVMRNSLIGLRPADAYCTFDADDVMMPGYLEELIRLLGSTGLASPGIRYDCDEWLGNLTLHKAGAAAQQAFTHEWLEKLGGFRSYRCESDADLVRRARVMGGQFKKMSAPMHLKRVHEGALTVAPETCVGSPRRGEIIAESWKLARAGELHVEPETTALDHIDRPCPFKPIDVVYVWRRSSRRDISDSVSLVRKHLIGCGKIYVVWDDPKIKGVCHIPADNFLPTPDANMIAKVKIACKRPYISDSFLRMSDDHFIMRLVVARSIPLYHKGPMGDRRGSYGARIHRTKKECERRGLETLNYECHRPIPVHKEEYLRAYSGVDADVLVNSVYGNMVAGGEKCEDFKDIMRRTRSDNQAELIRNATFVSLLPNTGESVYRAIEEVSGRWGADAQRGESPVVCRSVPTTTGTRRIRRKRTIAPLHGARLKPKKKGLKKETNGRIMRPTTDR